MVYVTLQGVKRLLAIDLTTRKPVWTAEVGSQPAGITWHRGRLRVGVMGSDHVAVVDPAVTVALAVGLGFAWRRKSATWAMAGLAVAVGYLGLGAVQHARAVNAQAVLAAERGHTPERIEVMPTLGNVLVWRALYEDDGKIFADRVRIGLAGDASVRPGWALAHVREGDLTATERARNQRRSFARFDWFAESWVARSPADATVLGDMRYSMSTEAFDPVWGIRFTAPGETAEVAWVNRSRERKISPRELWEELRGRDPRFRPVTTQAGGR